MKSSRITFLSLSIFIVVESASDQTNWDTPQEIYFDSANNQNHSPGLPILFPTTPSPTDIAWGYCEFNMNGAGGFPVRIFPPRSIAINLVSI